MTAACLHHRLTGDDRLLDAARRAADFLVDLLKRNPDAVARGARLQAFAYASAVEGEGAYLFADPERAEGFPLASVRYDDPELAEAFEAAVRTLLSAWDRGSFLPRLEMAEGAREDPPCAWCQVSEACARGDSGARMRLRRWSVSADAASGPAAPALAAARAVFQLSGGEDGAGEEEAS